MSEVERVFCIGFHKTATSSLEDALELLGYRVHGFINVTSKAAAREGAKKILRDYNSIRDFPWPVIFKWLDKEYPNSKFILTVRDEKDWIESVCGHFGGKHIEMHKWIYGCGDPIGNEDKYLEVYNRHNKEVINYFGDRRGEDLLVLNITEGEGWEKICPFLKKREPLFEFPKVALSTEKVKNMNHLEWVKWKAKQKTLKSYKHYKQGRLLSESVRYVKNKFNN